MSAARVVLDSHAVIALLRGEPGGDKVREILLQAGEQNEPVHMSEVNYAEVQYTVRRKEGLAVWQATAADLAMAPIQFHPADRRMADGAAGFKARHKLSLADAFAAALAKELSAKLVTGDPEFKALAKEIDILWLR